MNGIDYKNINLLNNIDSKVMDINSDFNELKALLRASLIIDDDYCSANKIKNVLDDVDEIEKSIKNLSISCSNSKV